jgi:oligo-alginate lyase
VIRQNQPYVILGVFFLTWIGSYTAAFGAKATDADGSKTPMKAQAGIEETTLSIQPHPRLFYTPEKIKQLRSRIENKPAFKAAWQNIRDRADQLLSEELVSKEYAEGGRGQHGNYGRPSRQISTMAMYLGLAFQVTQEKTYAEKLREALLHFTQLKRWAGDAQRDPPWNSELNTAHFCFGYALGYDSIYHTLSETDRRTIAQGMIRLGILPILNDWVLPEKRIHALDSMGHNWWSVCVAMAGVASLSLLGDEPQASNWVHTISRAFPEWFYYRGNILQNKSRNFDNRGAFYESVNYANYALFEYLLFHLAYQNTFPDDSPPQIPLLDQAGDFFVHTCYPTTDSLLNVNFGDGSLKPPGARTLQLLITNGFEKNPYHWYLNRTDDGINDPLGIIDYQVKPIPTAPRNLPHSILYPEIGWAMMRSSWQDNATMLAVKSGIAWNHAHPDAGSFILFHGGKPLIIDSGNCSYSRREYTTYYRHSKAHNVVLTDGHAQNPQDIVHGDRGTVTSGRLRYLLDTAGIKYVLADATGPTSWKFSRNYRQFLWLDDIILIFDDIRTHESGKLEWLLHYDQKAEPKGSDIYLTHGDAKVLVKSLYPEQVIITEKTGLKDHDPDTQVPYLALSPPENLSEAKFITAIIPLPAANPKSVPKFDLLQGRNMIGVRVTTKDKITDVYYNLRADGRRMHRNSNNIIDGWETDACLFALTRPVGSKPNDIDSITRCMIACGSYLRKNDTVLLDSLSKIYTVFTVNQPNLLVDLQGQPILNATIHTPHPPRSITIEDSTIQYEYTSPHKSLILYRHSIPDSF